MIVVDAHEDIAYNAVVHGRDFRKSAYEKRREEAGKTTELATSSLPDALRGRVALMFSTLFCAPFEGDERWGATTYKTPQQAYEIATRQWDYLQRLADESDQVQLVRTIHELDQVLATWEPGTIEGDHKLGMALLIENADCIIEPKQFEEWYERGVRLVGPAWHATRYCGGTSQPGPLTDLGRELLDVMASFNAILDLSHMAEESFLESVDRYEGILIASHSNPRKFRTTDRHLSDEMILKLAERDGVMGTVIFNSFLSNDWSFGDPKSKVPLSVVLDSIDYICQLTGSSAHVGLGTDFDGGFGTEATPEGIDTVADLWLLGDKLRERGYSEADVEAILSGNMLRKLRQALPAT
jgi:membrane dipeptidase